MTFSNIIDRIAITIARPKPRMQPRENPDFPQHLQQAVGFAPPRPGMDPVGHFMLTGGWF